MTLCQQLIGAESPSGRSQKDPKDAIDHFVDALLGAICSYFRLIWAGILVILP